MNACGKAAQERQRVEIQKRRAELLGRPGWVAAVFPGLCAQCGESFDPGTPISADKVKGWLAECCSEGN